MEPGDGAPVWCSAVAAELAYYHSMNWYTFPVLAGDKKPYIGGWERAATLDRAQWERWCHRWPRANVGLACGPSSLVVVDVDHHRDGERSWSELVDLLGSRIAETLVQMTPRGGRHYVYSAGGHQVRNRYDLRPGVDVRGEGGYILVSPSVVGGVPYRWQEPRVPVLPLPRDLAVVLVTTSPAISAAISVDAPEGEASYWLERALARAVPGTRNAVLYWMCCQMRDAGISRADAERAVYTYASRVSPGDHPFTVREGLATCASAYVGQRRARASRG